MLWGKHRFYAGKNKALEAKNQNEMLKRARK